jgi:hypothetical protein
VVYLTSLSISIDYSCIASNYRMIDKWRRNLEGSGPGLIEVLYIPAFASRE